MKKYLFPLLSIFALVESSAAQTPIKSTENTRPNVLIIFPDQLRRYSAGFWSEKPFSDFTVGKPDPVVTPNIDQLAKSGVVFANGIANYPLCSPSRGMLLSGMYPEQNGIWNNCKTERDDGLKSNIQTITDLFYKSGYNTAYFGKAHWMKPVPYFDKAGNYVGTASSPGGNYLNVYDTYVPPGQDRHHIEYFYQSVKDTHFNPFIFSNDPNVIAGKKDGELYKPKIFSPKNEAALIIDYLQNKNAVRDTKKPFFMIWSLNPPHPPFGDDNTDLSYRDKYYGADKFKAVDRSLVVRDNADLKEADFARNYFANVSSMDHYVGLVLDELRRTGVLKNTIVVFSSDHGEMLGSHGLTGKNRFELESIAVPMIISWPGKMQPQIRKDIFGTIDILPTVMGLAGLENNIPQSVQGRNVAPVLAKSGSKNTTASKPALLMLDNARGILTDTYLFYVEENEKSTPAVVCYNNQKDPYQLNKLSISEVKEAKSLLAALGRLLKEANDPWYKEQKFKSLIVYP